MVKKPPVHVLPREGGWAVAREGKVRASPTDPWEREDSSEG